jgi:hypothetical protein
VRGRCTQASLEYFPTFTPPHTCEGMLILYKLSMKSEKRPDGALLKRLPSNWLLRFHIKYHLSGKRIISHSLRLSIVLYKSNLIIQKSELYFLCMKESNKGKNMDRFWRNGTAILTCPEKNLVKTCPICKTLCMSLSDYERKIVASRASVLSPHNQGGQS